MGSADHGSQAGCGGESAGTALDLAFDPGLSSLGADFFLDLVPNFEEVVYVVNPVITPSEIRAAIHNMHASLEDAALTCAFAAVTINLTQGSGPLNGDVLSQMRYLLQCSVKAHRQLDALASAESGSLGELPVSIKRVMTCVYLEICTMGFKHYSRSFAMVREAISLLQLLHTKQQCSQGQTALSARETSRQQRLYWELYIHERFLTMATGYPSMLPPLDGGMPLPDPTIPKHVEVGFGRIISLFRTIDDSFLGYWNAMQNPELHSPQMTALWIQRKQAELDDDECKAAEEDAFLVASGIDGLNERQHADIFVTRLWLRTLLWQLALSRGFLCSAPSRDSHQGLSLHFPARRLSSDLRSLVSRLASVASIGNHGSGILQKLFEITSTVADVLALPVGNGSLRQDLRTQVEDFVFLVRFLFSFERIQEGQRRYLREKMEGLQDMYTVVDFGELAGKSPSTGS